MGHQRKQRADPALNNEEMAGGGVLSHRLFEEKTDKKSEKKSEKRSMDKKLLAMDIDGTLTNSRKEITAATKQAVQGAILRGHKVVLASGRPTPGMRGCEEELELKRYGGYLLSYNGGRIVESHTGRVLYQKALPLSILPELYQFAAEKGCGLITYEEDEIISAFDPDKYVGLTSRNTKMKVRKEDKFIEYVNFPVCKCLMTAEPQKAEKLERQLIELCGDRVGIFRSEPYFIEVVPVNVTKAAGLAEILRYLNIRREDTVCCGDGFNDIEMLRFAGVGVAMENAQPVVKAAADYITSSNDEDGIVEVIEKFFP